MGHGKNYEVVRNDPTSLAGADKRVVDTHLSASKAREKADRRHRDREPGDSHYYEVRKEPKRKK